MNFHLPTNEELEANYRAGRWARMLCWHRYKLASGMYGDAAVDCIKCGETHYTSAFEVFILRLLGKVVKK